jgi:hypothetical protein
MECGFAKPDARQAALFGSFFVKEIPMNDPLLTVALIVAITSFFKKVLTLSGRLALLAAFIVTLFFGLAPVVIAQFPVAGPWLSAVVNVIVLFLAAAGSYDLVMDIRTKVKPPEPGL